jgi:hypothetical protein
VLDNNLYVVDILTDSEGESVHRSQMHIKRKTRDI